MSITVYEAMQLDAFKNFEIVAGRRGLENKITRVGILDYETNDLIEKNFAEGEFVISTLLVIKNKVEDLFGIVERLISVGASGLAIKSIYFDEVPENVIKLAEKEHFPIMIFYDTYFEDIITQVLNSIKEKEEKETLTLKIDNILYSGLDAAIIRKIAYEINRNFKEFNIAAFCKTREEKKNGPGFIISRESARSSNKLIPYKDGYLYICTFDKDSSREITGVVLKKLEIMGFTSEKYIIGISSLYKKLNEINYAVKESLYACMYSTKYGTNVSCFNEIGVNKLLLPLIDNPWVLKYHDDIIEPLIAYDKKNDTELLKTAVKYIENNGDIKATARELFQHDNTVRYRIERINKILNEKSSKHFYEELAVAVRIYNLLDMPL